MGVTTGIVETGVANTASVSAALRRGGADVTFVESADAVDELDRIVVPGVGAFRAGMAALSELGVTEALIGRIEAGRPTLLVCLGMQLLFASSDESPGVEGLGVVSDNVASFPPGVMTPQFGWNVVEPAEDCHYLDGGYAYFANSYRVETPPPEWKVATTDHGGRFVAAMERDAVLACQFHPELSGAYGQGLIDRWLRGDQP